MGQAVGAVEAGQVVDSGSLGPAQFAKRVRKDNGLICWTCDKRGHFARDCPERVG